MKEKTFDHIGIQSSSKKLNRQLGIDLFFKNFNEDAADGFAFGFRVHQAFERINQKFLTGIHTFYVQTNFMILSQNIAVFILPQKSVINKHAVHTLGT